MEQNSGSAAAAAPSGRRRLNLYTCAVRTRRILDRLRAGSYDDFAREEGTGSQRVRQIVKEALSKRVIDRGEGRVHLKRARLAARAVKRGDLAALGPLLEALSRVTAQPRIAPERRSRRDEKKSLPVGSS